MTSIASFSLNGRAALARTVVAGSACVAVLCALSCGVARGQAPAPAQVDQLNGHDVDHGWGPPVDAGGTPQPAIGPDSADKIAHPIRGSDQPPGSHAYRRFVMTMCRRWTARFGPDGHFNAHGVSADLHVVTTKNAGTGGSIDLEARNVGDTQITITNDEVTPNVTYVLSVHVVVCPPNATDPRNVHRLLRGAATDWIVQPPPPG